MINKTNSSSLFSQQTTGEPTQKNKLDKNQTDFRNILIMLTQPNPLAQTANIRGGNQTESGVASLKSVLQNISEKIKSIQNQKAAAKSQADQNISGDKDKIQPLAQKSPQAQDKSAAPEKNPDTSKTGQNQNVSAPGANQNANAAPEKDATTESAQNAADKTNQTADERDLEETLESLGLNPEQAKDIMNLLLAATQASANDPSGASASTGKANPADIGVAQVDPAQVTAARQQLASMLKDKEGAVKDFLAKIGFNETDAKDLVAKLEANAENKLQIAQQASQDAPSQNGGANSQNDGGTGSQDKSNFLSQLAATAKPDKAATNTPKSADASDNAASSQLLGKIPFQIADAQNSDTNSKPRIDAVNPQTLADAQATQGPDMVKIQSNVETQGVAAISDSSSSSSSKTVGEASPLTQQATESRGPVEKTVVQQIVEKFSVRASGQQSEINIKLDPPSLGTVRMNVSTVGETVKTTLIAENHAAKQLIESNLNQLRDSLAEQGLRVESFTVLVGGNQGNKGQNPQQNGAGPAGFDSRETPFRNDKETELPIYGQRTLYSESQSISVFA